MTLPPYALTVLAFIRSTADEGATREEIKANLTVDIDDIDHALTLLGPLHAKRILGGRRNGTCRLVYRVP
jgi:hypothetical protein